MKDIKNISGLNIDELHNMALKYGFLILKPFWFEGKPDIIIEVPTAEQRDALDPH